MPLFVICCYNFFQVLLQCLFGLCCRLDFLKSKSRIFKIFPREEGVDYIYIGEEIKVYYIIFPLSVFINRINWSEVRTVF